MTRTRTRAQVTRVNVSVPNFNGTRVGTGNKYNSAPVTRTSEGLPIIRTAACPFRLDSRS